MIKQALKWLGKNENDGSHKVIIDIYNEQVELPRGYKVKYTDAWCATFVSACAIMRGVDIPTECSCGKMIDKLKSVGLWQEADNYNPKANDLIFYDWDDNGVGNNKGYPEHIGIVEKVVGKTIYVIEGNYNNAVKRRKINVNGKFIRGFGLLP